MSNADIERLEQVIQAAVDASIQTAINNIVHTQLLPVMQSVANQVAEIWEDQKRATRELKWLRGRLEALEADFESLKEEHRAQMRICAAAVQRD